MDDCLAILRMITGFTGKSYLRLQKLATHSVYFIKYLTSTITRSKSLFLDLSDLTELLFMKNWTAWYLSGNVFRIPTVF